MKSVLSRPSRPFVLILITALLSLTWSVALADHDPAHQPILVTTIEDGTRSDGQCTLREAVISANKDNDSTGDCVSGNGFDTIVLLADADHILTKDDNGNENASASGDLDITDSVIIVGNNSTISGKNRFKNRIIHVISGTVEIQNTTITGGSPRRNGGGIFNEAELTLTDVTVTQNESDRNGGGIFNTGTPLTLNRVTVNGNFSGGDGGGISNEGTLFAVNVTISGNRSENDGGGIHNTGNSDLNNATVTLNEANADGRQGGTGGGLAQSAGAITISNTIVARNTASDCSGSIISGGYNLVGAYDSCFPISGTGDLPDGTDPLLDPMLADNGGRTFTYALRSGSPAIDKGNSASCAAEDQRGNTRPKGIACDIGAYEADPPVAVDDPAYSTDEDIPLIVLASGVLANDSDADGDPLTVSLASPLSGPSNGSLALRSNGSFTYTPNLNFFGVDSFTYAANDGSADSNFATVTITVIQVNEPPVAGDDGYSTSEDALLNVAAPGVIGNDSDGDGDPLTASLVSGVSNGALTLNADGLFTYAPITDFNGMDSFTYQANDGTANSNVATVTITVNAVNDLPVAGDDSYATEEDVPLTVAAPGVLGDDTDVDTGDTLNAVLVTGPSDGTLTLNADGSFTYAPDANFNGADSFTYQADDGAAFSNTATVTITVNAVNDAPIAVDDASYVTDEDVVLSVAAPGVLGNDTDVDAGDTLTVSPASPLSGPSNGSLALIADGSFTYSPDTDFNGTDSFTYVANDGTVDSNTATVNITINSVLDPIAAPSLIRVIGIEEGASGTTVINGLVPSFPNASFTLNVYTQPDDPTDPTFVPCDESITAGAPHETVLNIQTDADGYFSTALGSSITLGDFVAATVISTGGDESPVSLCVTASLGNNSWPTALPLSGTEISHSQFIDTFGQSLWFKFSAQPGSQLIITLTNLAANYDLTVYKDIGAAYSDLTTTADLQRLSAEFAPSAFSPSAFSPSAFSPSAFSPSAFSPSAFSPSAFSPSAFSPSAFSPSAFSPSAFSPSAFSPSAFSPSAFSPDAWSPSAFSPSAFSPSAFSPSAFSPSAFSPSAFSPSAFSAAQVQSLIGVSAFDGTAGEGLVLNTWNNAGDFYVRVRGREGAFSLDAPFTLGIVVQPGTCGSVSEASLPSTSIGRVPGSFSTVILTNLDRMEGSVEDKTTLMARLNTLAARAEVQGVIVDVSQDARVQQANLQADANLACPFAKNLVADSIRSIVDLYRSPDLQYVVIVGGDGVIPFFRHPDEAWLGPEEQYVPPVLDSSSSQASLRLNYVLSQEDYGAKFSVSYGNDEIPIPDLAVGRLVETALEATNMIDAYLLTSGGTVSTPTSSLVTGYDFLEDAANEIQSEFQAGLGSSAVTDSLITPGHIGPEGSSNPADPLPWTADDLASDFLVNRYDLTFLAGHFSASSALAADYRTTLTTQDLLDSPVDMTNSIIFSAGCHSGYNIVNADGVPFVTIEPDWAQAFAQKGATFLGGTGYQYGDTEFLEYSERIYLEFSRQLRKAGAVSVGDALVASKQIYLSNTPQMRGIHAKAFLEATLFGLPMLSVDMPGAEYAPPGLSPVVSVTNPITTNPGSALGLSYADLTVTPGLVDHTLQLNNYETDPVTTVEAFYLSGSDGVVTNPLEPALPLELRNVSFGGTVLRGVGFLGGNYTDLQGILPLTGAPTTEIRGVHTPFVSSVFYPVRPWGVNYFDTLTSNGSGITKLAVTPAQFRSALSDTERGTLRKFTSMDFRLYYSSYTESTSGQSALAAPPTVVSVGSSVAGTEIQFSVSVVDNPAAGIQEVWVTYTDIGNPGTWQSVDLHQNEADSTLWEGSLVNVPNPGSVRYIAQAANGLGLVTMATNLGNYYIPGAEAGQGDPTTLSLDSSTPSSGKYGTQISVSATLTDTGTSPAGLQNKVVTFFLGSVGRVALTDGSGTASVSLPVFALPGENEIVAIFAGDAEYAPSGNSRQFSIHKRDTQIALVDLGPLGGFAVDQVLIEATLTEADPSGRTLPEQTIVFNVTGTGGSYSKAVITDYLGRASLGEIPLPPGDYSVDAYFSGNQHGHAFSHEDERYNPSTASFAVFTLKNTKPNGVPDIYTLDEDTSLTTTDGDGVLANDTDVDNQSLVAVIAEGPLSGVLTLNSDGSFTYTPNEDFNGEDSFTYFANDGIDNSDPVTVSLTVNPVNDAPIATGETYNLDDDDGELVVAAPGVLANDVDPDGDPLTAILVTTTKIGSLVLNADGSFVFTSDDDDFDGTVFFEYLVSDGTANSAKVRVIIRGDD